MFWLAQVRTILEAKRVQRVLHGDDATSSTSHGGEMDKTETRARVMTGDELTRGVACSVILHGLGEIPFACVMPHQEDPRKMWELLLQRYSARSTISKSTAYSSLAQTGYTGQVMQEYIAQRELMSA